MSLVGSPDGSIVVISASTAPTALVAIDPANGRTRWRVSEPRGVFQQSFSPDGRLLYLNPNSEEPEPTRVLDTRSGEVLRTLPPGTVTRIGVVAAGTVVAQPVDLPSSVPAPTAKVGDALSAVPFGTQLYDAKTLEPIGVPLPMPVGGQSFVTGSADGTRLAQGSWNGVVVVWDIDVRHWERTACKLAGRNLTLPEWSRYLPDQPYTAVCPQWPRASA